MSPDDFASWQGWLVTVAYPLLGSLVDAEDVVQDVAETWSRTDRDAIEDPQAWLVTVTTRRCLDRLRSAQYRRETYVGSWLPEPRLTSPGTSQANDDPAAVVVRAEEVSFALLLVLERLQPAERIAFVLHDVFGEPYPHIASILGRTPQATRQLASRARRRIRGTSGPPESQHLPQASPDTFGETTVRAFREAIVTGDLDGLLSLLDPEAVLVSDGGGVVRAARRPVLGAERIARFFVGLAAPPRAADRVEVVMINGNAGLRFWLDRRLVGVAALDLRAHRVGAVYVVVNPAKLTGVAADR